MLFTKHIFSNDRSIELFAGNKLNRNQYPCKARLGIILFLNKDNSFFSVKIIHVSGVTYKKHIESFEVRLEKNEQKVAEICKIVCSSRVIYGNYFLTRICS